MKKILNILLIIALLIAGAQASIQARAGDSCDDPILLTPNYSQRILQAGSYWYVANTFDLPMAITFYPATPSAEAPKLELDFGCVSGVYDDPVLCNLFCNTRPAYVSLPYVEHPPKSYDDDGKVMYRVAFGTSYRDMLLSAGIDYNIPVYIHATFYCGGSLEMEPDAFNNCMDGPKFMHLGDTVKVKALDKERHVIVPYIQWQYDSIRYIWKGTKPCIFGVSNTCDFDPTESTGKIIHGGPSAPIQPGGQYKVSSAQLMKYVMDQKNFPNEAGMYFAKFYSEEPGEMKIERIPAPDPGCSSTLMRFGESTTIERNDTDAVYAIPSSWIKPMQFTSPTSHILKMYIGKKCDFLLSEAIAVYQYDRIENGHQLDLFADELEKIWKQKDKNENYLYVRFECSDKTTVRPALWTPSDCMTKAPRLAKGKAFDVGARSKEVFGLYYADWKGGDLKLTWASSQSPCLCIVADTCDVPNSFIAPAIDSLTVPKNGAVRTIPQSRVDSWERYVDPDGYLYFRFYSTGKSKMTLNTTAPEEEDNPCPTYDSISEIVAWDSCFWHGTMYYEGGRYTAYGTLDPETGCYDSIFTLNLMIRNTTYDTYTEEACDSIVYRNTVYRESGVYYDTLSQTGGHRKITTLYLTIPQTTRKSLTIRQYDPYTTASGKVLTQTGVYADTIKNVGGCDSIITYDLTIYQTSYEQITQRGCDSIMVDGKRYTASGEYVDTLQQASGDRIIRTLDLTIGHTTYADEYPSACGSYTSPRGVIYTKTGDYTEKLVNVEGCDSIISLHVTVGQTSYGEETLTSCERYTSPWGHVYTESGTYTEKGVNVSGCDSIVTLYLTIIPNCRTFDTVYFCRGFNYEHEEVISDTKGRRYLPYVYEAPTQILSEVIARATKASEPTQTLLDLKGAEAELRAYFTGERTPITTVIWTLRKTGEGLYTPIVVESTPQWVAAGKLAVQIQFCCGEIYNDEYPTAVEQTEAEAQTPVKRMVNGQLIILRGDAVYTPFGQRIQ